VAKALLERAKERRRRTHHLSSSRPRDGGHAVALPTLRTGPGSLHVAALAM